MVLPPKTFSHLKILKIINEVLPQFFISDKFKFPPEIALPNDIQ